MDGLVKKITTGPTPTVPSHYSEEWRAVVRALLSKEEALRPSAEQILVLPWLQNAVRRRGGVCMGVPSRPRSDCQMYS